MAIQSLMHLPAGTQSTPFHIMQETYAYAKTLLDVATSNPDGKPKALLVGGGIANFTDVAATFKGIIQVTLEVALYHSCRHADHSVCLSCTRLEAKYSSIVADQMKGKDKQASQCACKRLLPKHSCMCRQ